jgi:hypothetical protein
MLQFFRGSKRTIVLKDADSFWRYADETQRKEETPDGPEADAEERLDLRAGQAIKQLLERHVGPEEGENHVHSQDWDWNDDRCRAVSILTSAFKPEVIPMLQELLVGEFSDFKIIVLLVDDWDLDEWGCMLLTAKQLAIQKNVAQTYAIAA